MSLDDAFATPLTLLRPSSFGIGAARPSAALCIRFPADDTVRETVLRGLLRREWQLVSAPVGEFEPLPEPHARLRLLDDESTVVEAHGQIVFEGPLRLSPDLAGRSWHSLAIATKEIPVLLTVGSSPIGTTDDADTAARAGRLLGIRGRLAS